MTRQHTENIQGNRGDHSGQTKGHRIRKRKRGDRLCRRGLRLETLERRCLLAADITSDLVGYWALDETSIGSAVLDSSASGNDGTHTNIASPNGPSSDAVIGSGSLSLDGVDDYVAIGPAASLDLSGGRFTQSLWINPSQADTGYHGILGFQASGDSTRYPSLYVVGRTQVHGGFGDGTAWNEFTTGSVLTENEWNHLVATFDGTQYTLYVNGQSVFNTAAFAGKRPFATTQLDIGRVDNNFRGKIDDVRIYARALTQEDVQELYLFGGTDTVAPTAEVTGIVQGATIDFTVSYEDNLGIDVGTIDGNDVRVIGPSGFNSLASLVSVDVVSNGTPRVATYQIPAPTTPGTYQVSIEGNQVADTVGNFVAAGVLGGFEIFDSSVEPDPTGLVGHWKLEETAIGQTVLDVSGRGNNGTHVNLVAPSGPSTVDPARGAYSLNLDGVDDYVSVGPSTSLNLSGGRFTQSVWIKPQHTDDGYHGVLGYEGAGSIQRYPSLYVVGRTQIHGGFGDGAAWNEFTTGSVLTEGEWNHLAATFDGTDYRLYVNGQQVFSTPAFAGKTPFPIQRFDIGRVDNNFRGSIDDVRIYTRPLTPAEISQLFTATSNTPGTLALGSATFSVSESGGSVEIPVIRSGGSSGTVTIDYATAVGTAVSPGDFTSASGTLTFLAGETLKTIVIPITNDATPEVSETFSLTISNPTGGAVLATPATGEVTIVDDDSPSLSLVIADDAILETAGLGASQATVTRSSADLSGPLTVTLTASDLSELAVPTSVEIPAGQPSVTFLIDALDDAVADGTQTVTIVAEASGFESGSDSIDVLDNELPSLSLAIAAATVAESAGVAATTMTVSRSGDLSAALTVTLSSDDVSEATTPASVVIPAGQASAVVNVDAIDDLLVDGDKGVTFSASATGYTAANDSLVIADDDVPTLSLVIPDASVSEGAGLAAIAATVSHNLEDLSNPVVVTLVSSDLTELAGPASVTIPAGQASIAFALDAIDDAVADGTQTVTITASSAGFIDGTDVVAVTDDDAGAVDPTLVGHWRLEESAIGQPVLDSTAGGNDGSHVAFASPNGPSGDAAVGSRSLNFDGVDDYVSIGPAANLDLSGGTFSQSLWIKPNHTDTGYHGFIGYQGAGETQRYPSLYVVGRTQIHGGFGDGTVWNNFTTGSVLTEGQWNHVVATFDGTVYTLYVDGQSVFNTTAFAGKVPFSIGRFDIGRVDNFFRGSIDDVRIYSRALTPQDVLDLYANDGVDAVAPTATVVSLSQSDTVNVTIAYADNLGIDVSSLDSSDVRITGPSGFDQLATLVSVSDSTDGTPRTATYQIGTPNLSGTYQVLVEGNQVADVSGNFVAAGLLTNFAVEDNSFEPDPTGLIGRWKFEETAIGQPVLDVSGLGNDGTHVNIAAPNGPSATELTEGAYSLNLDGVDDYVSIGPDPSLALTAGQFTQSVWIYPDHADIAYHGILGYDPGLSAQRYPSLYVVGQTQIHGGFGDGTTWNNVTTGTVLTLGQWNHVVATFDGVTYTLYVNGTGVLQTDAFAGKVPFATNQLDIGRVDTQFRGWVDDVRLYSRALDANEVGLLYVQNSTEAGVLQMADREYTVNESEGVVLVEVIRTGGAAGEVTVNYTTVDGSAVSPSDYVGGSGVITFADGQVSQFIEVPIVNDSVAEANESFSVSLAAPGGGAGLRFPRTRLINVVDDDAPAAVGTGLKGEYYNNTNFTSLALVRTDPVINFNWGNGSPSGAIGADTFSVRWTGSVVAEFSETYTFYATSDDGIRVWVNGNLIIDRWTIQSPKTTTGSISLVAGVPNDIRVDYFENTGGAVVLLEWSSPSRPRQVVPKSQLFDGAIAEGPVLNFAASVTEVDESAGTVEVTVLRLGDTSAASSVAYTTSSGTAVAGSDFTAASGTLNFAPGESSRTISISILDDGVGESLESFFVTLQNPVDAALGLQNTIEITVLDNDAASFTRETVVDDLFLPVTFDWAPDGSMFVAQKAGQVLVFDGDGLPIGTFIDISDEVNDALDRGLIGFTLHPQFPEQPYAYLAYAYDPPETQGRTGNAGPDGEGNRVNRLVRVTADPATNFTTAIPGSELVVLGKNSTWENISRPDLNSTDVISVPPSCAPDGTLNDCLPVDSLSHAIGAIHFSLDGTALFVSVGDGTSYGTVDPRTVRVQNLDSLSGKLLRIDPLTGEGLSDNPFFDGDTTSNRSRVYSYGLRNPFRFTLHPSTGEPYIGDVGWAAWEEINTGRGANFGWPFYEGAAGGSLPTGGYQDLAEAQAFYASGQPVVAPIYSDAHVDGAVAIVVGDFYTGSTFPSLYQGALFFADLAKGTIDFLTFDAEGNPEPVRNFATGIPNIVHMATGPDGNLYYTDISGEIGRFVPSLAASTLAAGESTSDSGRLDVNSDGSVSALDALVIINVMSQADAGEGEFTGGSSGKIAADVNGDQRVSALDAIQIINYLGRVRQQAADGETANVVDAVLVSDDDAERGQESAMDDGLLMLLADDLAKRQGGEGG